MRVVGGSPGALAARLREALARTPPDKGYKGLTSLYLINTTPWTPFSNTCVVFPNLEKTWEKSSHSCVAVTTGEIGIATTR